MNTLEQVVENKYITWGDLLRLNYCKDCMPFKGETFELKKDERITKEKVHNMSSEWADWIAYALASRPDSGLTRDNILTFEEKRALANEIEDDLYKHHTIRSISSLKSQDLFILINGTKNEDGQRVGGIKDEWWRYRALCNIKHISGNHKFEIVDEFRNELYIMWAVHDIEDFISNVSTASSDSKEEVVKLNKQRRLMLIDKIKNENYIMQIIKEFEDLDFEGSTENKYRLACKLRGSKNISEIIKEVKAFSNEQITELTKKSLKYDIRDRSDSYVSLPPKKTSYSKTTMPASEHKPKPQTSKEEISVPKKIILPDPPKIVLPKVKKKEEVSLPKPQIHPYTPRPIQEVLDDPIAQIKKSQIKPDVQKPQQITEEPIQIPPAISESYRQEIPKPQPPITFQPKAKPKSKPYMIKPRTEVDDNQTKPTIIGSTQTPKTSLFSILTSFFHFLKK